MKIYLQVHNFVFDYGVERDVEIRNFGTGSCRNLFLIPTRYSVFGPNSGGQHKLWLNIFKNIIQHCQKYTVEPH